MAGHPLRPATRRSLGEPLPHQQADRPRAHPSPPELSTTIRCLKWSYPVLAPVSGGYPDVKGRLLTCYSPVRRSCTPEGALPLDLHVLSTPPAFVLSQDQTLRRKQIRLDREGRRRKKRCLLAGIKSLTKLSESLSHQRNLFVEDRSHRRTGHYKLIRRL